MVADMTPLRVPGTTLSRPDGRTAYTPERLAPILEYIANGVPPSRAAPLCGVSHQALSDWRREREGVQEAIHEAEGRHIAAVAADLRACRTKWGTPDPKALELELRRYPEYAQHQVVESHSLSVTVTMSAEQVAALHAYHCATLSPVSESVTLPLELSDSGHVGEANT